MKFSKAKESLEEDNQSAVLSEMANVTPKITGLPMNIYISDKSGLSHGPRIKVQTNHAQNIRKELLVSVSISENPEIVAGKGLSASDFASVRDFIVKNRENLLRYWNLEIGIDDLLDGIVK